MLILSRKLNESIVIDGRITVKVVRVDGDVVKLGISAPADVPIHREEIYEEIRKSNHEALTQHTDLVPKLLNNEASRSARSQTTRWQDRQPKSDTERQPTKSDNK